MLSLAVTKRRRDLKNLAISYKGGKCSMCGYCKSVAALEFHHVDPKQKEIRIGGGRTLSWERLKTELDKCILVCSNCHREIHEEWKSEERQIQERLLQEKARKPKILSRCKICGKEIITTQSIFHENMTCSVKCRSSNAEKISWPSNDELKQMVAQSSKLSVAKMLGVSDKAVAKRLKGHDSSSSADEGQ